jgi:hypothetical protein
VALSEQDEVGRRRVWGKTGARRAYGDRGNI